MKVYTVYLEHESGSDSDIGICVYDSYSNKGVETYFSVEEIHDKTLRQAERIARDAFDKMMKVNHFDVEFFQLFAAISEWNKNSADNENLLRVDVENFRTRRFKQLDLKYVVCETQLSKTKKPEIGAFHGVFSSNQKAVKYVQKLKTPSKKLVIVEVWENHELEYLRLNHLKFDKNTICGDFDLYTPKSLKWRRGHLNKRLMSYKKKPISVKHATLSS